MRTMWALTSGVVGFDVLEMARGLMSTLRGIVVVLMMQDHFSLHSG